MRRWPSLFLLGALGCGRGLQGAYDVLPPEGEVMPTFDLGQLDGGRITTADLTGRLTVVAFWSSTCGASRQALAAMVALHDGYASRGVRLVMIADDRRAADVKDVLDSIGARFPVALAAGKINTIFGQERRWPWQGVALPSFLLVDAAGIVRSRVVGVEADSARRLERVRGTLDVMLKPPPAQTSPPAA